MSNGIAPLLIGKVTETDLEELTRESLIALAIMQSEEIAQLRASLFDKPLQDRVTELFRRDFIENFIPLQLERGEESKGRFAVLIVRIDGHSPEELPDKITGKFLLRLVAGILDQKVRSSDIVGYWEEKKYIIFLPRLHSKNEAGDAGVVLEISHELCKTVRKVTAAYSRILGERTVSIGAALTERHGYDFSTLVEHAAKALKRAQEEGKGKVRIA